MYHYCIDGLVYTDGCENSAILGWLYSATSLSPPVLHFFLWACEIEHPRRNVTLNHPSSIIHHPARLGHRRSEVADYTFAPPHLSRYTPWVLVVLGAALPSFVDLLWSKEYKNEYLEYISKSIVYVAVLKWRLGFPNGENRCILTLRAALYHYAASLQKGRW